LNTDENFNGTCDDEILERTLKCLGGEEKLIMVHFHGIDDAGHTFGDLQFGTMEAIKRTDGYIKDLISTWSGVVIITSDHGMHSTPQGGSHGSFLYQDMVVPYILIDE